MNTKQPFSYHIFLFPFKWEINDAEDFLETSIDKRCDIERVKQCIPGNIWDNFNFKIQSSDSGNTYNEFSYFYEHVRPILSLDLKGNQHSANNYSVQYSCKLEKAANPQYEFTIENMIHPINLVIDEITLNLYKTGIGIVSFFLANCAVSDFNTILKINEYGRRIYPQFLDQYEGSKDLPHKLTTGTKNNFLPNKITLRNVFSLSNAVANTEEFSHYDTYDGISKVPFILPKHLTKLLGNKFKTRYENAGANDVVVTPIIDDRMYVMSFLTNTEMIAQLSVYDESQKIYDYERNEEWYRYVFIDDSTPTCANRDMLRRLIGESTYPRWIEKINTYQGANEHQGSIWGSSRYSLVVIAADCLFNNLHLLNHFKTVYFQLVLLSITQRASALSYSDEASRIANRIKEMPASNDKEINHFSDLQKSFLVFKSIINFHEVTAQEQGIELYHLIRNKMNVDQEVDYLQNLIQSLNDYVQTESERKRAIESHKLTKVATLFLPAGIIASLFGISFIGSDNLLWGLTGWIRILVTWGIIIVVGGLVSHVMIKINKSKN